ncbi:hypothetical protein LWI28_000836 [Acer negundo]|uniref:Aminopeptidase P N-terminal domain-containing protein n=1 Tax=Acer negundo TaxID=4023 RepID=A0AAD5J258_ACENE|nr:hypothetical protein LWI28_000836 [Acer negundo]
MSCKTNYSDCPRRKNKVADALSRKEGSSILWSVYADDEAGLLALSGAEWRVWDRIKEAMQFDARTVEIRKKLEDHEGGVERFSYKIGLLYYKNYVYVLGVAGQLSSLESHIDAVKAISLFERTDFKLASYHHPLTDKVAHECGFTSLSIRIVKELVTLSSHPLLIPPDISNAGRHLSAVEFHSLLQSASLFVALSPFSNHVWLFSKLLDEESPTDDDNQIEEAVHVCELCQKQSRSVGSVPSTEDGKMEFASTQFELKTVNSDPSISLQPTWRHGSEYPRKRRILCLHRFRQNASSFKGRNASLAKKLKNILSLFLSMRPMSCHSFINLLMHYLCCKVVHHHNQRTVERIDEGRRDHTRYRFSRRKRLLEFQSENSVAILAAASVKMMIDVVPYMYQQDADYLYITGSEQPGGLAVLSHDPSVSPKQPSSQRSQPKSDLLDHPSVVQSNQTDQDNNPSVSEPKKPTLTVRMLRKGLKEIGIVNRNGTDPYNELNPTSIGDTIEPGFYIPSSFDGPESTNNFIGRQTWKFDPNAGTPNERAEVEAARQNFFENRFEVKPSSDLLWRMQFLKEKNFKQTIPPVKVEDHEEITYETASTALKRTVHFFSALQASDGHWPA